MARRGSVITDDEEELSFNFDDEELDEEELDESGDSEEEDESEDDSDDESDDEEDGETETPEQSQFNWEDDSNPYKQRFKGLQGSLQQSQERVQDYERRVWAAEAQAFKASISHLSDEEQALLSRNWLMQKAAEYQMNHNVQQQQAIDQVARGMYITQVATEFGVDPKKLERFKDPDDMRAYAEDLASMQKSTKKTVRKEVRKVKQANKFGSGGGRVSGPPKKKAKNLDQATDMFSRMKLPTTR
jgi:hypothetical protein